MNPQEPVPQTNPVPNPVPNQAPPSPTYPQPGTPVAAPSPVAPAAVPQDSKKPPVLVQVLFALGIIGFIIGTFLSLVMISLGSNSIFGAFGDMVQAIGFGLLLMMLFILWLLLKVRAGKLWALIVYSVLSVLGIISVLSSRSDNAQLSITAQVVTGLLLLGVWIKNRDYFA